MNSTKTEELIEGERLKQIETRWKSDVDFKLDRLVRIADKYEKFLEMLLDREEASAKWRNAVIEKSTVGLVWAMLVFLGMASWEWVKRHLGDPK